MVFQAGLVRIRTRARMKSNMETSNIPKFGQKMEPEIKLRFRSKMDLVFLSKKKLSAKPFHLVSRTLMDFLKKLEESLVNSSNPTLI